MKAIVFHGIGDIRLDNVREPRIEQPNDAIVRLTASAICGTDLHMIRGTVSEMKSGTILGHEGVGIVEEVGPGVRNLTKGDRVVIPSTIACGSCSYCRVGYFAHATRPIPMAKILARLFSAALNLPAHSTAFRQNTPASHSPMSGSSNFPVKSRTIKPFSSPTFFLRATLAPTSPASTKAQP